MLNLSPCRCYPVKEDTELLLIVLAANLPHIALTDEGVDSKVNGHTLVVVHGAFIPLDDTLHSNSLFGFDHPVDDTNQTVKIYVRLLSLDGSIRQGAYLEKV